jgi:hypothetical protein
LHTPSAAVSSTADGSAYTASGHGTDTAQCASRGPPVHDAAFFCISYLLGVDDGGDVDGTICRL